MEVSARVRILGEMGLGFWAEVRILAEVSVRVRILGELGLGFWAEVRILGGG